MTVTRFVLLVLGVLLSVAVYAAVHVIVQTMVNRVKAAKSNPKVFPEGFPEGFKVQRIEINAARAISGFPPSDIAKYFREHPETARALLLDSYDKRYTPATYIEEKGNGFTVAWFTRDLKRQCVQEFSDLSDAATDYLLFSLGKGRWTPAK